MEINERNDERLEKLCKKAPTLERNELDKSLGKNDNAENIELQKSDDISFKGRIETERDLASSKLQDELRSVNVYPGTLYSDKLWGGLDAHSGNLVHNALNDARNSNRITGSDYKDLMTQLKKACHHQS